MAGTIRLNCRMVVWETLFCIGCKSAKMFTVGFLWVWVGRGGHNSTTEAHSNQPIFGEGIDHSYPI